MVIQNNMHAANADRQMSAVSRKKEKTSEKLSSGYAINRSADDAAGLRISEGMRRMVRGLDRGSDNLEDGISLIQTADGALSEVSDILQRMNELSIQSANGTNSTADRTAIQEEASRLAAEIDRIGKSTTFNERAIFDYPSKLIEEEFRKRIPHDYVEEFQLVSSEAADRGFLTDVMQIDSKSGPRWHPAATLDFGNVSGENIPLLEGKYFSFNCSADCKEQFKFVFKTDGDGTQSSVDKDSLNGYKPHIYTIDISACKTGADVVDAIYGYVKNNMPNNYRPGQGQLPDALKVSHSNEMVKTEDGNGLSIYAVAGFASPEAAQKHVQDHYLNSTSPNEPGKIDANALLAVTETIRVHARPGYDGGYNGIRIQGSSNTKDGRMIRVQRMNAEILGVRNLDLTTEAGIDEAIDVVSTALSRISASRSELGAEQNRLGHASRNNKNTMENTQASESRIRDTDMAKETVALSRQNILTQSGVSVLTQANQTPEGALALLA